MWIWWVISILFEKTWPIFQILGTVCVKRHNKHDAKCNDDCRLNSESSKRDPRDLAIIFQEVDYGPPPVLPENWENPFETPWREAFISLFSASNVTPWKVFVKNLPLIQNFVPNRFLRCFTQTKVRLIWRQVSFRRVRTEVRIVSLTNCISDSALF